MKVADADLVFAQQRQDPQARRVGQRRIDRRQRVEVLDLAAPASVRSRGLTYSLRRIYHALDTFAKANISERSWIQIRSDTLPVAVIGAGPVGLAAAAHLRALSAAVHRARGRGARPAPRFANGATSARSRRGATWSTAPRRSCSKSTGWPAPDADASADRRRAGRSVRGAAGAASGDSRRTFATTRGSSAVGRKDFDKVRTKGRDQQPFEIRLGLRRDDRGARGDRCQRHVVQSESRRARAASPRPASASMPIASPTAFPMCRCASARDMPASASSSSAAATRRST